MTPQSYYSITTLILSCATLTATPCRTLLDVEQKIEDFTIKNKNPPNT